MQLTFKHCFSPKITLDNTTLNSGMVALTKIMKTNINNIITSFKLNYILPVCV